jgi:Fusaric acid resistance protein family
MRRGRPPSRCSSVWASVCLTLYVTFWLQLDNEYWAGTSAVIVCQPHLDASLRRGWFRTIGTVTSAIWSASSRSEGVAAGKAMSAFAVPRHIAAAPPRDRPSNVLPRSHPTLSAALAESFAARRRRHAEPHRPAIGRAARPLCARQPER